MKEVEELPKTAARRQRAVLLEAWLRSEGLMEESPPFTGTCE